ncbi:MAG: SGNH/GDSL hydrolase family protein [Haloferula sp.]
MKSIFCGLSLILISISPAAGESSGKSPVEILKNAKRVVFLGDSITAACTYTSNFTTWAEVHHPELEIDWMNLGLASETVSGLSEEGHAGGRFPRPDLHERLARVLDQTKPDLVFACYGMNCGIYQPLDDARFAKYRDGIQWLKTETEAIGAQIIFLTPPYYDALRRPKNDYYAGVLAHYSNWLIEQRRNGWMVIDLNRHMTQFVTEQREEDPNFTIQPDGIHPNVQGHWIMAQAMISWFGDAQSAKAPSAEVMLSEAGIPVDVAALISKRTVVLHDAWLTETKHTRPGVRAGKPMPEAQEIASDLTKQIDQAIERSAP